MRNRLAPRSQSRNLTSADYVDWAKAKRTVLPKLKPTTIPNAVVNKVINKDKTPIRAWRQHLGLTRTEVARRLGISQSAYAQQEAKEPVRKATRQKIAEALGIAAAQLAV